MTKGLTQSVKTMRKQNALDAGCDNSETERRPATRAECVDMPRPCPWISCRWNLAIDVNPQNGSLKIHHATPDGTDIDWAAMAETCALDVAAQMNNRLSEEGYGTSLEAIGKMMNITRERVRQIQAGALLKLRATGPWGAADAREAGKAYSDPSIYNLDPFGAGNAIRRAPGAGPTFTRWGWGTRPRVAEKE